MTSSRLHLQPVRVDHAKEMGSVLAASSLYEFTGGTAPSLEHLQERYVKQTVGASPDGTEMWLNWIIRVQPADAAAGFVQATVLRVSNKLRATVAWVVAPEFQSCGIATEATRLMMTALSDLGVREVRALIIDGHVASESVARHVGLVRTEDVVEGEQIWSNRGHGAHTHHLHSSPSLT
ncbi:GNAT family N-acetyltransferase [Demequina sediminicola]|uniref:GNAT family N-acetyltransferase n=1 Tax=Demequina sediminicola TaxID=1095026 RepID=UPI000AE20CDF|nr:GNAT family N-acetyltransferase [Demequina sediminicola]